MVRQINFSNEAQNRAAVTISAAMYERKALDCTASLPLIFSLNNLAYLVANNRKIRDLLCVDGGLERLIQILREVPKNHGPFGRPRTPRDLQPMWKWTTAFQCVVHLCIRGGISVRERAVEAGILPILVKVLESYLCFSDALRTERKRLSEEKKRATEDGATSVASAAAIAREAAIDAVRPGGGSREQRHRHSHQERAGGGSSSSHHNSASAQRSQTSSSSALQHQGSSAHMLLPAESRVESSGSRQPPVVAPNSTTRPLLAPSEGLGSPAWTTLPNHSHSSTANSSGSNGASSRRAQSSQDRALAAADRSVPVPIHPSLNAMADVTPQAAAAARAAAAAVVMSPEVDTLRGSGSTLASAARLQPPAVTQTTPVLVNTSSTEDLRTGEGSGSGSEEGLEEAEMSGDCADPEDSEADGSAPERQMDQDEAEERQTPRATRRNLAPLANAAGPMPPPPSTRSSMRNADDSWRDGLEATPQAAAMSARSDTVTPRDSSAASAATAAAAAASTAGTSRSERNHASSSHSHHHGRDRHATVTSRTRPILPTTYIAETFDPTDMAFREEEVLLSLQILAYLTKYSHIRALLRFPEMTRASNLYDLDELWDKAETSPGTPLWQPGQQFHRSIYTIAERYTCRATKRDPNAEYVAGNTKLAPMIQYWAGVVMRNACRKDDREGDVHAGLRQCGNMLCGKWETEPREFAKCRRCKKAKFCSKVCQSTSWQIGHKYWCSSTADDESSRSRGHHRSSATQAQIEQQQQQEHAQMQVDTQDEHTDDEQDGRRNVPGYNARDPGANQDRNATRSQHENGDQPSRLRSSTLVGSNHRVSSRQQVQQQESGAHEDSGAPSGSATPSRRLPTRRTSAFGRSAIPQRVVSEAASAAASDMSEDEVERTRNILPSDGDVSETNEGGSAGPSMLRPPPAPLRTDIAGRPLPPPVIAGSGLDFGGGQGLHADPGMAADESFGRMTPVDDQFGRGDIDQITWRGQTPTPDVMAASAHEHHGQHGQQGLSDRDDEDHHHHHHHQHHHQHHQHPNVDVMSAAQTRGPGRPGSSRGYVDESAIAGGLAAPLASQRRFPSSALHAFDVQRSASAARPSFASGRTEGAGDAMASSSTSRPIAMAPTVRRAASGMTVPGSDTTFGASAGEGSGLDEPPTPTQRHQAVYPSSRHAQHADRCQQQRFGSLLHHHNQLEGRRSSGTLHQDAQMNSLSPYPAQGGSGASASSSSSSLPSGSRTSDGSSNSHLHDLGRASTPNTFGNTAGAVGGVNCGGPLGSTTTPTLGGSLHAVLGRRGGSSTHVPSSQHAFPASTMSSPTGSPSRTYASGHGAMAEQFGAAAMDDNEVTPHSERSDPMDRLQQPGLSQHGLTDVDMSDR